MNDIKARMPRDTSKGLGLVRKPINIAALASRRARDRSIMGLKAWIPREGSLLKEFRMLRKCTFHLLPPVIVVRHDAMRQYSEHASGHCS